MSQFALGPEAEVSMGSYNMRLLTPPGGKYLSETFRRPFWKSRPSGFNESTVFRSIQLPRVVLVADRNINTTKTVYHGETTCTRNRRMVNAAREKTASVQTYNSPRREIFSGWKSRTETMGGIIPGCVRCVTFVRCVLGYVLYNLGTLVLILVNIS